MSTALWTTVLLASLGQIPPPSAAPAEFALHDGDTVVFLGDSITAARTYSKLVETFTLLRFPQRRLRYLNRGIGGDTAHGAVGRLDRDVFAHQATVLVVMFGVNDIGWGLKADDEHRQRYLDAIRQIVQQCQQRKIRAFVCSAPVTAEAPDRSETGFLKKMCDDGMAASRALGGEAIDVQGTMRMIQRRILQLNGQPSSTADKPAEPAATLHAADGVHLNELGQLAVAYALLKGWKAPAEVSRVELEIEPESPDAVYLRKAQQCRVTDLAWQDGVLAFTRLDESLPFNYGLFFGLHYAYVPVPKELNQYLLTIRKLPPGAWTLTVDGRAVGTHSAHQWSQGINLASATADAWQPGGPWDVQATLVKSYTEARHEVDSANLLSQIYSPASSLTGLVTSESTAADRELTALQRRAAEPRPYRFTLRRAPEKSTNK